ncbi:ATPase, T2SS/T4P/T4SS family, partial [Salmonella enterica]|uniref:ATPase, T2SS/T4P/T4SS family n=1 Tax=Salmonella enterica TaxID=28901 RepID=UPI001654C183|nr:Flp pilus assembly complex ATPase component TadA [Salmonella enterica subsp. enterica serovar Enteritidis]
KLNILIAGGTGSGKTSMLNALSSFIPEGERVVVIEDSRELQLQREHICMLEARPPDPKGRGEVTIRDLFRATLRLRPDR